MKSTVRVANGMSIAGVGNQLEWISCQEYQTLSWNQKKRRTNYKRQVSALNAECVSLTHDFQKLVVGSLLLLLYKIVPIQHKMLNENRVFGWLFTICSHRRSSRFSVRLYFWQPVRMQGTSCMQCIITIIIIKAEYVLPSVLCVGLQMRASSTI